MAVTIVAFFPPVSAKSGRSGRAFRRLIAVAVPPVRITAFTSGFVASVLAILGSEQGRNCSVAFEMPARQKHWHSSHAGRTAVEAGLRMTVLPAASAAAT